MEHESTYEGQQREALLLMQRKLPQYVINCFVAAGFDTIDAIATMDISKNPENSLHVIEEFINRKHPNDPQFTSTNSASTVEFPPGHRGLIESFVREVKGLNEEKRRACKRHFQTPSTMSKRRKVALNTSDSSGAIPLSDTSSTSSCSLEASTNLGSIMADVRQQLAKWQRRHKNARVRDIKEHEHFEISVRLAGEVHIASVRCKVCGKNYSLGMKHEKPLISNWTRHIERCLDSPHRNVRGRRKLDSYFSKASSATPLSSPPSVISQGFSSSPEPLSGNLAMGGGFEDANTYSVAEELDVQLPSSEFQLAINAVQEEVAAKDLCTHPSANNPHFRLSPPK